MKVKDTHLIGKQVELIYMKDEPQMEKGLRGVITFVDGICLLYTSPSPRDRG